MKIALSNLVDIALTAYSKQQVLEQPAALTSTVAFLIQTYLR